MPLRADLDIAIRQHTVINVLKLGLVASIAFGDENSSEHGWPRQSQYHFSSCRRLSLRAQEALAVTGHEMFERAYRIQKNTLENAALLLPALWVNAAVISDRGAAALGAFWLTSKIWYAIAYQTDPAKRGPAFGLSMTAFALAWCAGAWGIKRVLMS